MNLTARAALVRRGYGLIQIFVHNDSLFFLIKNLVAVSTTRGQLSLDGLSNLLKIPEQFVKLRVCCLNRFFGNNNLASTFEFANFLFLSLNGFQLHFEPTEVILPFPFPRFHRDPILLVLVFSLNQIEILMDLLYPLDEQIFPVTFGLIEPCECTANETHRFTRARGAFKNTESPLIQHLIQLTHKRLLDIIGSVWMGRNLTSGALIRRFGDQGLEPPVSSQLLDLRRERKNVQRRITHLKNTTLYPKKRVESPVSLYIASRRQSIGSFPPGLGSATNKPDMREMYRDFYADWQTLSAEQKMSYIEQARENKAYNFQELKRWHEAHGKTEKAVKLTELERTLRDLKTRLKTHVPSE
ncbi:hypothetical protein TCAL_16638 [Tigriopus californicus]|uniref:HMG box domain-containing protein n=1 Tax=Tigriopus californicus TaxID=6832 RepID=A0A553NB30_TIGCA|nr:hypothetical protein TCAL_16638 [Tigriopus californicus]